MSPVKNVLVLLFGCIFIMLAFVNPHFYARKGWFAGEKEIPRWVGRTLFAVGGVVFFVVGAIHLWIGG